MADGAGERRGLSYGSRSQSQAWKLSQGILFGPSAEFARAWLAGAARTPLARASRQLADAAWFALEGLARHGGSASTAPS